MNYILGEILKYVGSSAFVVIVIIILLLKYPEKVEKWLSMLLRLLYFITKKGSRKIIALDIQGRINEFSKSLKKELPNYRPVGIEIQWIIEKSAFD